MVLPVGKVISLRFNWAVTPVWELEIMTGNVKSFYCFHCCRKNQHSPGLPVAAFPPVEALKAFLMSTKYLSTCWSIAGISPSQKLVLISLADQANDSGVCWPSVPHMTVRTGLSERAIRNSIRSLEDAGLLICRHRTGRSTWYDLTPALNAPLHHVQDTPAPDAPPPLHQMQDTPAPRAAITIKEPSIEPSLTNNDVCVAETKSKKEKVKVEYTADDLVSVGIDGAVARDFLLIRRQKKAMLTETALKGIVREAQKAGYSLEQALSTCVERNWVGFNAEWVRSKQSGQFITFHELATGHKPEF